MRGISLLVLIVLFFAQCKKTEPGEISLGKAYYPIAIDYWQEYKVDSIVFSDFTNPVSIDTYSYEIREVIESSFQDLNAEENFRIEQFKRNPDETWVIDNIFSLKETVFNIQKVEHDLRFIKLVFPVSLGKTWNGHIYLNVDEQPLLNFYNTEKYEWEYNYTAVDESLEIGGFSFDSCVTIIQIDEENLFEKKYSKEIYAKNVGLVYKELIILDTQAPPSSSSFTERAENGFILKYTISDYKK